MGTIMGLICWQGGVHVLGNEYTGWQILYVLLHRTLMGTFIGMSGLKVKWLANGAIYGLLTGILFVLYEQITKDYFGYMDSIILALIPTGIVYGIFIEYLTTKIFKAPSPYAKA